MTPVELVRTSPVAPADPLAPRALRLSDAERSAVTALVQGDERRIVDHARARATALADEAGGDDVRRRSLARAVAVAETQMTELAALLGAAVARRDEQGVRLLDRTLTSATQRFRSLVEELRLESNGGRRAVVMVASGPVAIAATE